MMLSRLVDNPLFLLFVTLNAAHRARTVTGGTTAEAERPFYDPKDGKRRRQQRQESQRPRLNLEVMANKVTVPIDPNNAIKRAILQVGLLPGFTVMDVVHCEKDGFKVRISVSRLLPSKWAKIGKCSQDTAARDIQDLIEKNILYKLPGGGRSTGYDLVKEKDENTPAGNKS